MSWTTRAIAEEALACSYRNVHSEQAATCRAEGRQMLRLKVQACSKGESERGVRAPQSGELCIEGSIDVTWCVQGTPSQITTTTHRIPRNSSHPTESSLLKENSIVRKTHATTRSGQGALKQVENSKLKRV